MANILKTTNLHKTYLSGPQPIEVLKGIDLSVDEGELIVIIGPSGVGKSTLLHLIGGLDKPTKGTILIDNVNLFDLNDKQLAVFRNRSIGFVFQFHHLLEDPEYFAHDKVHLIQETVKSLLNNFQLL